MESVAIELRHKYLRSTTAHDSASIIMSISSSKEYEELPDSVITLGIDSFHVCLYSIETS